MWNSDDELDLLFDPKLIPADVKKDLNEQYHIRPLAATDYHRSYLALLSSLTSTPDAGYESWSSRFSQLKASKGTYYIVVIVDRGKDQIVASGTLLMELKFQRDMGQAAHIEDVVVDPGLRGSGLGKVLMGVLTRIGEGLGGYKTILDCREQNVGE